MNRSIFKGKVYEGSTLVYIGVLAILLPTVLIIFFDFLNDANMKVILNDVLIAVFIFPVILFILTGVYFLGKKGGYYDPDAYEIAIGGEGIRIRNGDRAREIDGWNINRLKIKGRLLIVWPKDYYYFIDHSDGMERHNYYAAMEKKLPLQFRLPALSRKDKKRLKEVIEEFKRINGLSDKEMG